MKTVSVICPIFNNQAYLADAINSVLTQTQTPNEFILIDDGSTDRSALIAEQYAGKLNYYYQKNAGQMAAINHGLKRATGDYIAFIDADDMYVKNKIELLSDTLDNNPETDIVFGLTELLFQNGSLKITKSRLLGAGLFRKQCFEQVGFFLESYVFGGIIEWYARAMDFGLTMTEINHITFQRRIHDHNMTLSAKTSDYIDIVKAILDRRKASSFSFVCNERVRR